MDTRARRRNRGVENARSDRDLELDFEVGRRIEGYRWVEWNREAFDIPSMGERGRFVGHPGDLLAHLYVDAAPETPPSPAPYARLPLYSTRASPALRAAERAGLFAGTGASLSCAPDGTWRIHVRRAEMAIELEDDSLPRLLCSAALRCVAEAPDREDR